VAVLFGHRGTAEKTPEALQVFFGFTRQRHPSYDASESRSHVFSIRTRSMTLSWMARICAHERRHQPMTGDLGDITIFFETYGAGRPIVVLPGPPSDHRVTLQFMEHFFTQRDVWPRMIWCSTLYRRSSTRSSPVNASCSPACPIVVTCPVAWSLTSSVD